MESWLRLEDIYLQQSHIVMTWFFVCVRSPFNWSYFDCSISDENDEVFWRWNGSKSIEKMFDFSFNLHEHAIPWTGNMGKENLSLSLSALTSCKTKLLVQISKHGEWKLPPQVKFTWRMEINYFLKNSINLWALGTILESGFSQV